MKKFTKEQLIFFIISIISVLLLTYRTVGFDLIAGLSPQTLKYQSSVDSIITLENSLFEIKNNNFSSNRDLFNFLTNKRIVVVQPVVPITGDVEKIVKKSFSSKYIIEPWSADKLELVIMLGENVKLNINGSARQYSIGDPVQCANGVEIAINSETNEPTGKKKDTGTITGTIYNIDKRNVYISIPNSSQMIKLNARDGAKLVDSDFVPKPTSAGSEEGNSDGSNDGSVKPKPKKQR